MTIRHLNRIRKKHLEEKTGTSGKNRPPHPPPTPASKPFWWIPCLGKAERLSPFPRRKNEGKNAEPKDHNAKDRKAKTRRQKIVRERIIFSISCCVAADPLLFLRNFP